MPNRTHEPRVPAANLGCREGSRVRDADTPALTCRVCKRLFTDLDEYCWMDPDHGSAKHEPA